MLSDYQCKIIKNTKGDVNSSKIARKLGITYAAIHTNVRFLIDNKIICKPDKQGRSFPLKLTKHGEQLQEYIYKIDSILSAIEKNK